MDEKGAHLSDSSGQGYYFVKDHAPSGVDDKIQWLVCAADDLLAGTCPWIMKLTTNSFCW
jgi:hypothetical protein